MNRGLDPTSEKAQQDFDEGTASAKQLKKINDANQKIFRSKEAMEAKRKVLEATKDFIKDPKSTLKKGKKNLKRKAKKGLKSAKEGAKALKTVILFIVSLLGPTATAVIAVVALLMFAFSSVFSSLDLNSGDWDSMMNNENGFGEVCKVEHGSTYKMIKNDYEDTFSELRGTLKEMLEEKAKAVDSSGELAEFFTDAQFITSEVSEDGTWTYTLSLDITQDVDETHKIEKIIDFKINAKLNGIEEKEQLINSIIGYVQSNYAVIKTYSGEAFKEKLDIAENTKEITQQIGEKTKDGSSIISQDYCLNVLGGTVSEKGCTYTYKPAEKKTYVTKTGTCSYDGTSWVASAGEHECSTEEWIARTGVTDGTLADTSTYEYTYKEEQDSTIVLLEDFSLDDYKVSIQNYIDDGKLFYYTPEEWTSVDNLDITYTEDSRIDDREVTEKTLTSCVYSGSSWNGGSGCASAWASQNPNKNATGGDTVSYTESNTVTKHDVEVKIYKMTGNGTVEVSLYTGVDADDKGFLGEEKEKTIRNIEKLNKAEDKEETGEYSYNEALNEMVVTLNFICPDYQIDLSLISGSSYSSFKAVTTSIDNPGVFGETQYWYDSSKGLWDTSQLSRQDVYDAVWSYNRYLRAQGLITGSAWINGGCTPQCVDLVHTEFYAVYGKDCGAGNGKDMAANTIAKYPDEFYNGVVNGSLQLKAGSIISKPGSGSNIYGHVGFIEAVETDDSGNITSITISDANFSLIGCAGGVRMHCVYTWEQFVSAWGLNCTFAVPIN